MIYERLMAPGAYTIPMRIDAPYGLWNTVKTVVEAGGGHIVITPQWLDPRVIGDAGMLAAARYAGPVLTKTFADGAFTIGGSGMGWWLGDDNKGDVYESEVTLSSAAMAECLTALLPDAITQGDIEATSSYTGLFHYDIPRDAVASLMANIRAEYRINPDGTMDAGFNTTVFNIDTPTVVVTRFQSGADPNVTGVSVASMRSVEDVRAYATRALLIDVAEDSSTSLNDSFDQSGIVGKDIHGNTIVKTLVYDSAPGGTSTPQEFLRSEVAEHVQTTESVLSTSMWELSEGTWNVGDAFWVYDDPAFVDTGNEVRYRGDVIHPLKMRLIAAAWPLIRGMGVAFRDDAGVYTDLTDWVKWEAQDDAIGLGSQASDVGGRQQAATALTVRTFVEQDVEEE